MPILLPPLNEQNHIVAAIEQQFTCLDAGISALKRTLAKLKRYRAAILKAAVEGKLTEAWRAEHPTTEPASMLLERILKERRVHGSTQSYASHAIIMPLRCKWSDAIQTDLRDIAAKRAVVTRTRYAAEERK